MLKSGPPVFISDKHALPLDDDEEYVVKLWFASTNEEVCGKLDGAVEGEERDKLWEELKEFIIVEGKEEGDDEEEGEEES